jgi:hypothetical protein
MLEQLTGTQIVLLLGAAWLAWACLFGLVFAQVFGANKDVDDDEGRR